MHAKFCSLTMRAHCLSGKDWGFTGIGVELVSDNLQWQILNILCLCAHVKNYEPPKKGFAMLTMKNLTYSNQYNEPW